MWRRLKAECVMGWKPRTSFAELVSIMVKHDIGLVWLEAASNGAGRP